MSPKMDGERAQLREFYVKTQSNSKTRQQLKQCLSNKCTAAEMMIKTKVYILIRNLIIVQNHFLTVGLIIAIVLES